MIILLAILGAFFFSVVILFLLKDFFTFIYWKTVMSMKQNINLSNMGENLLTVFIAFALSVVAFVCYKICIALFAYLLSDDLISFFILLRGVFTAKAEIQSPLGIQNIFTGVLLSPLIQFITIYILFISIRGYMSKINLKYKSTIYSDNDVIYFGLISVFCFDFLDILFYTQDIGQYSSFANICYLSISKFSTICYFLAISHIHLLHQDEYRSNFPNYLKINAIEKNVIFSSGKLVLVIYLVGILLNLPFYTGIQFSNNNTLVIIFLVTIPLSFFFILKYLLKNGFNYVGIVMLAESKNKLNHDYQIIKFETPRKLKLCLGIISILFLILKPKLFFFGVLLFALCAFTYVLLHLLSYGIGLIYFVIKEKLSYNQIKSMPVGQIVDYLLSTILAFFKTSFLMLLIIVSFFILISVFPKRIEKNYVEYTSYAHDIDGKPMYIESYDGNKSIPIIYSIIPPFFLKCLYIQEDRSFTQQQNIMPNRSNWHGFSLALFYRFFFGGGGSNINAQLIKNLAFYNRSFPQDIQRKFSETIASYQLSLNSTPQEIVRDYLNVVGMNGGNGQRGIILASLFTFGLPVEQLNRLEMLYLISTLKNGNKLNMSDGDVIFYKDAHLYPDKIKEALVSKATDWFNKKLISKQELSSIINNNLRFYNRPYKINSDITTKEFFKNEISNNKSKNYVFQTGITQNYQERMYNAVKEFERCFNNKMRIGNFSLFSAAIVVDVKSGEIKAHYGGKGVTELTRFGEGNPIGSLIKPFLIVSLLENGYEFDDIKLYDGPIHGKRTPKNYSKKYSNKYVDINEVLGASLNAPMVNIREIADLLKIIQNVEDKFKLMGIFPDKSIDINDKKRKTEYELNYPLGSRRMTVYNIAQAYQVIFNNGEYIKLKPFVRQSDLVKNKYEFIQDKKNQIYTKENANIILNALSKSMLKGGTGSHIKPLLPEEITFYAKTGTSDNAINGYTVLCDGENLIVVWVSYLRIVKDKIVSNSTTPIPFESGVKSAGVFSALIYNELFVK